MKRIPNAVYQTPAEIEARIREREDEALDLAPDTNEHRALMREIAQLRVYAEAKRWMASPTIKRIP
jgi:hypothetical protein